MWTWFEEWWNMQTGYLLLLLFLINFRRCTYILFVCHIILTRVVLYFFPKWTQTSFRATVLLLVNLLPPPLSLPLPFPSLPISVLFVSVLLLVLLCSLYFSNSGANNPRLINTVVCFFLLSTYVSKKEFPLYLIDVQWARWFIFYLYLIVCRSDAFSCQWTREERLAHTSSPPPTPLRYTLA